MEIKLIFKNIDVFFENWKIGDKVILRKEINIEETDYLKEYGINSENEYTISCIKYIDDEENLFYRHHILELMEIHYYYHNRSGLLASSFRRVY